MSDPEYKIFFPYDFSLDRVAELEPLVDGSSDSKLDIHPYTIPLEDAPETESLPEESSGPEQRVFSLDHIGIETALSILSPRERQILAMKVGLDGSETPHKCAEIADLFGLSVNSVASTLTRARNRLRAVPNIVSIINGEDTYHPDSDGNTLQTL